MGYTQVLDPPDLVYLEVQDFGTDIRFSTKVSRRSLDSMIAKKSALADVGSRLNALKQMMKNYYNELRSLNYTVQVKITAKF